MALDRLTQITSSGISSTAPLTGINITGVITATSITAPNYGNVNSTALNVSGVSTFQSNVNLGDNDKILLGDSNDLQIYHDGSNSIISDSGTGNLAIAGSNGIILYNAAFSELLAVFNTNGAAELYYDNSKELETTGYGATVFGVLQSQGLQSSGIITATNGVQVGSASSITVGNAFIRNNLVGLGTTSTTGRNAGINTATGTIIYNATEGAVQVYNGNIQGWANVGSPYIQATGGTISEYELNGAFYRAHRFTSSGTFNVTSSRTDAVIEYLVVAGGGGGGAGPSGGGGGGGAGGLLYNSSYPITPGSYSVTIGSGGAGLPAAGTPNDGTPSTISRPDITTITAISGGGGGEFSPSAPAAAGHPGGSGGGGGAVATIPSIGGGSGTSGQGNPGGYGQH